MKIHSFYQPRLLNGEHRSMNEEAIAIVVKFDPYAMNIQTQLADLQQALAVEDVALGRVTKNPYTDALHAADLERDNTLRGMIRVLEGNLHHPDPAIRDASESLLALPQMTPETASRGHEEEEALINILLGHLNGDYAAQVAVAGISLWINRLAEQNAEVNRLQGMVFASTAANEGMSVKDARKATDLAYNTMVNRLNALIEITPESYAAFVAEFNVMVKFYETAIKERAAHNRHKQKNLADANISSIADQIYTGDRLSPRVQVFFQSAALTEDKDFTVEYANNIEVGTANVTIKGKGAYVGKKQTTFNIVREI
jgi:hypothetical protein